MSLSAPAIVTRAPPPAAVAAAYDAGGAGAGGTFSNIRGTAKFRDLFTFALQICASFMLIMARPAG